MGRGSWCRRPAGRAVEVGRGDARRKTGEGHLEAGGVGAGVAGVADHRAATRKGHRGIKIV
eukprot:1790251-Rhodomonas_salina.1